MIIEEENSNCISPNSTIQYKCDFGTGDGEGFNYGNKYTGNKGKCYGSGKGDGHGLENEIGWHGFGKGIGCDCGAGTYNGQGKGED